MIGLPLVCKLQTVKGLNAEKTVYIDRIEQRTADMSCPPFFSSFGGFCMARITWTPTDSQKCLKMFIVFFSLPFVLVCALQT